MQVEPFQSIPNKSRVVSQSLQLLNEQASIPVFSLDTVDWKRPIDPNKNWMPHELVNIRFLPSYSLLTEAQKLKYNHLYGLAIAEQFIWFEQGIVIPIMERILKRKDLDQELEVCLHHFIEDELRHSALFKKLLQTADPEQYENFSYRFYNLNWAQEHFYSFIVNNPNFFIAWIWMTIYFEERTMHISKLYRQEKKDVDRTFAHCHHLHMLDEARHLQIDQYLLKFLYDDQPSWKKNLAAKMYYQVIKSYASPRRISGRILDIMAAEEPVAKSTFVQLKSEFPLLPQNPEFIKKMFGDEAIGRTRELIAAYPEMRPALDILNP